MDLVAQVDIECPYCGGCFSESFDTSQGSQQIVTDCSVCCRPMEIYVECEPGEILSVSVER